MLHVYGGRSPGQVAVSAFLLQAMDRSLPQELGPVLRQDFGPEALNSNPRLRSSKSLPTSLSPGATVPSLGLARVAVKEHKVAFKN